METRTILLISLVFALWTSTSTGQAFCEGKDPGPYCEHCWQPVDCTETGTISYPSCEKNMACTVAFGASYCVSHAETDCACAGAGDQCDAYNPLYIEHCLDSGPFLVEPCPEAGFCYDGVCGAEPPTCNPGWNIVTPDCISAIYCDTLGVQVAEHDCKDGEYVNLDLNCYPAPPPACDGSCPGRCPNPVDCTKFFICDGVTAVAEGTCATGQFFDTVTKTCVPDTDPYTCTFLNNCDFEVGLEPGITTTTDGITTSTEGITTTTGEITTTTEGITTTTEGIITTTEGITTTTKGITTTTEGITTTTEGITTTTEGITTTTEGITTTTEGITTTTEGIATTTEGITTTTEGITTTTEGITTTTDGGITIPPDDTCNASTVGSKYPTASCSKQYYVCADLGNGRYDYLVNTCLGDFFFSTDPNVPYCLPQEEIDSCQ